MRLVVEPHFLNLSANSRFALRAEHRRFDLNLRRPFSFAGCRRSRRRQGNVNLATRTNALTQRLVRSWSGPPRINIDGAPASMRFLHRVSASSCAPGYSRSQKSRKDLGTLAAPRSTTRHTDHSAASAQSGAASPSPDCARARGLPLRGEARPCGEVRPPEVPRLARAARRWVAGIPAEQPRLRYSRPWERSTR